jgi:hypothetical protein
VDEVLLEVLVDVIQIYFGDQAELASALVGDLYQRLYSSSGGATLGQTGSSGIDSRQNSAFSASPPPASALARMQRRSTYRTGFSKS